VLEKATSLPSSLTSGSVLSPAPVVTRRAGAPTLPAQICEMPVSTPVTGSLVETNASAHPFALTIAWPLVPCPVVTSCSASVRES
jgi:hypothetical protein